jgi:hypothetical protein
MVASWQLYIERIEKKYNFIRLLMDSRMVSQPIYKMPRIEPPRRQDAKKKKRGREK